MNIRHLKAYNMYMENVSNKLPNVRIIDFEEHHAKAFRDLNYEWLEKHFEVEPYDRIVLNNPQKNVIDIGGHIFIAMHEDRPIGTLAILKHTDHKYEIAKMGVTETAQGQGVGRKLIDAAIAKTRELGADKLVVATSTELPDANRLYKKMGFVQCDDSEIGPLPYKRHTIVMMTDV